MGYVTDRKARLRARLVRVQAQLEILYNALENPQNMAGVQSYAFDSGEGSQRTTLRSVADMQNMVSVLEAREDHIINEINNVGILSVRLRRTS